MTTIREFAPAKVNLTLKVHGKRADGYHEIESLVVFADVGDTLVLEADDVPSVSVTGPFAAALAGENIIDKAFALMQREAPELLLGAAHLDKRLPVAAGVGGGSADAGALLRALKQINSAESVDWYGLALALGADVPVCFRSRPSWMTGVGGDLSDIGEGVPSLSAVLVNPLAQVPADKTARVFRELAVPVLAAPHDVGEEPRFDSRDGLLDYMRARGNDLATAAQSVVPEIADVLAALNSATGVEYAAISGAGPTCFGVFPDRQTAEAAQRELAAKHSGWWVAAAVLS